MAKTTHADLAGRTSVGMTPGAKDDDVVQFAGLERTSIIAFLGLCLRDGHPALTMPADEQRTERSSAPCRVPGRRSQPKPGRTGPASTTGRGSRCGPAGNTAAGAGCWAAAPSQTRRRSPSLLRAGPAPPTWPGRGQPLVHRRVLPAGRPTWTVRGRNRRQVARSVAGRSGQPGPGYRYRTAVIHPREGEVPSARLRQC